MFKVTIGKEGLENSWQAPFPETTECKHCDGEARIGFVVLETPEEEGKPMKEAVCHLHKNDPKGEGYWLHDCCAVAVYFCKKCLNASALSNQG